MAKTFEQIRDEAMEFARKNDLDEVEAQKHLRRKLRNAGVALPSDMATEAEFKQQMKESEEFLRQRRNKVNSGKAEMRYGGMANGKKHMYACGGSVHSKK